MPELVLPEKRAGPGGKKESCGGLHRKSRALTEFPWRWTNAANLRAFRSKIKTAVT
jgi:hypothetical protein